MPYGYRFFENIFLLRKCKGKWRYFWELTLFWAIENCPPPTPVVSFVRDLKLSHPPLLPDTTFFSPPGTKTCTRRWAQCLIYQIKSRPNFIGSMSVKFHVYIPRTISLVIHLYRTYVTYLVFWRKKRGICAVIEARISVGLKLTEFPNSF